MSLHFSANQYQNAFIPHKLASWEVSKDHKDRPDKQQPTKIVANDRGHLLPSAAKSAKCPWGSYVGTWDLPCPISGPNATVRTARTTYAQEAQQHLHDNTKWTLDGWAKPCSHSNKVQGKTPRKPWQQPHNGAPNASAALMGSGRVVSKSGGGGCCLGPMATCSYQTEAYCGEQQEQPTQQSYDYTYSSCGDAAQYGACCSGRDEAACTGNQQQQGSCGFCPTSGVKEGRGERAQLANGDSDIVAM